MRATLDKSGEHARFWDRWGILVGGILIPIAVAFALSAYILADW